MLIAQSLKLWRLQRMDAQNKIFPSYQHIKNFARKLPKKNLHACIHHEHAIDSFSHTRACSLF